MRPDQPHRHRPVRRTLAAMALLAGTTAAVTSTTLPPAGAIIDGSAATANQFPYFVAFKDGCGGALLSSTMLLTAAHCAAGISNGYPLDINGLTLTTPDGVTRTVANMYMDPRSAVVPWDASLNYDVAVLQLSTPITDADNVEWTRLADPGEPVPSQLTLMGHGRTESLPWSQALLHVLGPVRTDSEMASRRAPGQYQSDTMLGVGTMGTTKTTDGRRTTAQGDSGGPWVDVVAGPDPVFGVTSTVSTGQNDWGGPAIAAEVFGPTLRTFIDEHVTRPANDKVANATPITGASGTIAGNNTDATNQMGEPSHAGDDDENSVWFTWTAPSSTPVYFSTTSSWNPTLAVYSGTSPSLTAVASSNDHGGQANPRVSFTPVAGRTYSIAVDGFDFGFGPFRLWWGPQPRCEGRLATIAGSGTLLGTGGDDVIVGASSADTIDAGGGNDFICSAGGNDTIKDGIGDDFVDAGDGDDVVLQNQMKDVGDHFIGGPGIDRLSYALRTAGVSAVVDGLTNEGEAGENDFGVGFENVDGGGGPDSLTGDELTNVLVGNGGDDILDGRGGDDTLIGGPGNDQIKGGEGTDTCRQDAGVGILTDCEA